MTQRLHNTDRQVQLQLPCWDAYLCTPLSQGVFLKIGGGQTQEEMRRRKEHRESNKRRKVYMGLITCLASSTDICSWRISFSYRSFILSTSWSWAATSSFRAPFSAVSSLSRLLRTSSCSSLARRTSCISTFNSIISCRKLGHDVDSVSRQKCAERGSIYFY